MARKLKRGQSRKTFKPTQRVITVEERARQNSTFPHSKWPKVHLPNDPAHPLEEELTYE
jgi:hypothetical protein